MPFSLSLSLSLSLYGLSSCLCVLHRTLSIASSSSVFAASALHYARFFFFLFFIPPSSPLFAPFLFVNYKSQLTLSFSLFLYFYLFYLIFWGGCCSNLGDCGRTYFRRRGFGFLPFCLVLHSLSFLGVGVFYVFQF